MKHVYGLLIAIVLILPTVVSGQDEGAVSKKSRIGRSSNIFLGVGPSFTFGKNIGDYSTGFNIEAGYSKRINRLLSIGPSISFLKFNYDPDETTAEDGGAFIQYIEDQEDPYYWEGYVIELEGGDLSLISLAVNLKINVIPVKDNSIISAYVFVKPFVTMAKRTEVYGSSTYLKTMDPDGLEDWEVFDDDITWGPDDYDALKSESKITGGAFLGFGVEFLPAKKFSFFVQPGLGYTFPITYVSTKSYDYTFDSYFDENFPMSSDGFTSFNVQVGVSFNF
jgi:hypothetical protein